MTEHEVNVALLLGTGAALPLTVLLAARLIEAARVRSLLVGLFIDLMPAVSPATPPWPSPAPIANANLKGVRAPGTDDEG